MMRSVVTKRGDKGISDIFGVGRIPKDSHRFHAQGTIDELNAILGILLAEPLPDNMHHFIEHIQHTLFRAGADLATPLSPEHPDSKRIRKDDIARLEKHIINLESTLPPQRSFLLPKGSRPTGLLHQARAVCRRAERWTVAAMRSTPTNPDLLVYLNRLSDYLFIAARAVNIHRNTPEEPVRYS